MKREKIITDISNEIINSLNFKTDVFIHVERALQCGYELCLEDNKKGNNV